MGVDVKNRARKAAFRCRIAYWPEPANILTVPLFIVAANIINAGTISDRLLTFCIAAVGRFGGGLSVFGWDDTRIADGRTLDGYGLLHCQAP